MKLETRSESGEKMSHCGSYQELVEKLVKSMEIVPERLCLESGEGCECERLEYWIQTVEYKQGKVPRIEVVLPILNQKELRFEVQRLESDLEKGLELDRSGDLLKLALIEAKMDVIAEIAGEVYPAILGKIVEWREEIGRQREEILGGEIDNTEWQVMLERVGTKRWMADIY